MSTIEYNWNGAFALEKGPLIESLFSLMQTVGREIQLREADDPELLAVVPRMLDLMERRDDLEPLRDVVTAAARSLGLWNYIDKERSDSRERLLAEAVSYPELGNIALHREQLAALSTLLAGKNVILSAPTSFGKSILIDALLIEGHYDRIAIVLPTIALLDEFRRRLLGRFGDRYQVLMHHTEKATGDRVIFLGTQERLINRTDLAGLDLLVVDEFYKLDAARQDDRSITLNAAVYQLLRKAKQFFFLGPNIQSVRVSGDASWKFEFLKTRFCTVAVDTLDLSAISNKRGKLLEEMFSARNWPVLVFVSSPEKANELAQAVVDSGFSVGDGKSLSEWIAVNFGGASILSAAVSAGVGLHHGRIPRALASRFVGAFNQGQLPILICTSTLIEGVNTAAKSVLIFDKTIAKEDYDFFTFSNIKGRAGRLGEHHVGQVVLFNEPPSAEHFNVTAPLFAEPEEAPTELVVHFEEQEVTPTISDRIDDVSKELGISIADLKRYSTLGIENLKLLKRSVDASASKGRDLAWTGYPTFQQLERSAVVICKVRGANSFGVRSARQLAFYFDKLRKPTPLKEFFRWHANSFQGKPTDWDNVVKFLRACEYSLPEYFGALQLFIAQHHPFVNYSWFIGGVGRWFRPSAVKELEEHGVPAQISERFAQQDESPSQLEVRLRATARSESALMTALEKEWVLNALPLDVGNPG